jgi:hypothetical protein
MVAIIVVVAYFVMVLIHWLRDWIAIKSGRASSVHSTIEKTKDQPASHEFQIDHSQSSSAV